MVKTRSNATRLDCINATVVSYGTRERTVCSVCGDTERKHYRKGPDAPWRCARCERPVAAVVTFYGTRESVTAWRKVVRKRTGKAGVNVTETPDHRHRFHVVLSAAERQSLMQDWYAVAPGQRFAWNERITFSEIATVRREEPHK